jgi:O-antigen ligase
MRDRSDRHADEGGAIANWPERLTVGLLGAAAVASPWAFGSVHALSQVVLLALVIAAAAVSLLTRSARPLPWLAIPLLLGIALSIVQLAPLSADTLEKVAPKSFALQQHLFDAPAGATALPAATARPISLYPAAGRHQLAMLVLAALALLAAARSFTTGSLAMAFAGAVALNGAALVLFGLVQRLTSSNELYWAVPLSGGGSPFGPFVNRNNAGGFLNMCLAGGVAMLFWSMRRREGETDDDWRYLSSDGFSWWERLRGTIEGGLANLDAGKLASLTLAGWLVAGVLATLSRGAALALVAGGAVTLLAAAGMRQRLKHLAVLGFVGLAGAGLLAWLGLAADLQARFDHLEQVGGEVRPQVWAEALDATPDFWSTGSGLGTFRYLFEHYRRGVTDQHWYEHAENQYVEALFDAGVPGLVLLIVALLLVGFAIFRLARLARQANPEIQASALGAVFAVTSQVVHGAFDFGLYLPANMVLLAIWCGLAISLAIRVSPQEKLGRLALPGSAWLCSGLTAGLVLAGVPALLDTWRLSRVEAAMRTASLGDLRDLPTAEELEARLNALTAALPARPDDADAQVRAAELGIMLYRLRAEDRLRAESEASISPEQIREAASTGVLHRRAQQLAAAGDTAALQRLRTEPVVAEHLLAARDHLARADRACPLLAKAHVGLAELTFLTTDPRQNAAALQRARSLAPADGQLLYHVGVLEWDAGRTPEAIAAWRESWRLAPNYGERILRMVGDKLSPAQIAKDLMPAEPAALVQFVRSRRVAGDSMDQWAAKIAEAEALVADSTLPSAEKLHLRAELADLSNKRAEAIDLSLQALALAPAQADWRLQLAGMLLAAGRLDEAKQQVQACAQFTPGSRELLRLSDEIENAIRRQSEGP